MRCEEIRSLLSAYLDGELEPAELQAVEGHLQACALCRGELELLQGSVELVRSLPEVQLPAGFSERLHHHLDRNKPSLPGIFSALRPGRMMRYRGWMAVAAVFLILLATGVFSDKLKLTELRMGAPPAGVSVEQEGKAGPDVTGESKAKALFDLEKKDEAPKGSTVERYQAQLRSKAAPPGAGEGSPPGARGGAPPGTGEIRSPGGPVEQPYGAGGMGAPVAGDQPSHLAFQRKLIKRAELAVEVKDVREAHQSVVGMVDGAQGYVERSSFSREAAGRSSASLTVRVPQVAFARVLEQMRALGVVRRDVTTGEDVTRQYVDLEARRRAMEMQESRLLSLLGRAGNLGDVLALERELARVRSEVESLTGQLKYLDNLSSLSTIQVELFETGEGGAATNSVWRQAWQAFLETARAIVRLVEEAVVLAGRALPVLLLLAGTWLGYRYWRRSDRRPAAPPPPPPAE